MASNNCNFQTKDESSVKQQETGDNDVTHEPCKDDLDVIDDNSFDDSTNILEACKNGNLDLLKVLVEGGISVQEKDERGCTCLIGCM